MHDVSSPLGGGVNATARLAARRAFLRRISAAGAAAGMVPWTDILRASTRELRARGTACILLWMQGGPSQFETFSPKPGHANGGETEAIATSVPGIQIAEGFPQVARIMDNVAVVRSMTSREGSHPRATFLLHTGYLPTASVKHPTLGSVVVHQIGRSASELPGFVRIGGQDRTGAGLLGATFNPLVVDEAGSPPPNTQPATSRQRFVRRLDLLGQLAEDAPSASGGRRQRAEHQELYSRASRMILSPKMNAFDLDAEPDAMRDAYGRHPFGSACLLARRLVEAGVSCVEVVLRGWDTHQDNFDRTRKLADAVDRPTAQLIGDLKQRGMLDRTLVVWMGEFGRTPRINPRGGRDHFPRAFNVALSGAGIGGGRVVGKTDAGGTTITDRPVGVADLFRTIYTALGIDPDHENMSPIGRPIKIVDGGEPIQELLS